MTILCPQKNTYGPKNMNFFLPKLNHILIQIEIKEKNRKREREKDDAIDREKGGRGSKNCTIHFMHMFLQHLPHSTLPSLHFFIMSLNFLQEKATIGHLCHLPLTTIMPKLF